jgi:hypothetical protein
MFREKLTKLLTRFDLQTFRRQAPEAEAQMTTIPNSLWNYWKQKLRNY